MTENKYNQVSYNRMVAIKLVHSFANALACSTAGEILTIVRHEHKLRRFTKASVVRRY